LLTCKDFMDELSEYLDGTIHREMRQQLETHVTECPNCWVMVDTTKRTIQIYKGMEPQPLAEDLHNRLINALDKKMAGPSP
jgi:anti-sigma factor RsiW